VATFSSHLLDATNGSHAGSIEVIIYQVKENGERKVFCETKSDDGGRILQEFE
jgi:5-hydroxyisourate hydrolase-like protein (transthyretin family)